MLDMNLVRLVFNEDWSVRACGREACSRLIRHLSDIDPGVSFGDAASGHMDLEKVVPFVQSRMPAQKCQCYGAMSCQ